jgi:hypothetical protein
VSGLQNLAYSGVPLRGVCPSARKCFASGKAVPASSRDAGLAAVSWSRTMATTGKSKLVGMNLATFVVIVAVLTLLAVIVWIAMQQFSSHPPGN